MAVGHVHALYQHGDSLVHRLPPHTKVVAAFSLAFAVVATPREAVWAFALYAAMLLSLVAMARLRPRFVASRMLIEIPFIVVALSLPFFAGGATTDVLGVSLSTEGLWDMWNIVIKATLGLLTSIVLAGTTQIPELLRGFDRLRTPRILTAIAGFMVRYLDVVLGEFRRMRVAMQARAYDPTWIGQVRPYATGVGRLFVRSYERGERVYLAMAARGYTGHMPVATADRTAVSKWLAVLTVPAAAWLIALWAIGTA